MANKEQKNIIIETSDFRFELKKYTPLTSLILCKISDQLKQDAEEKELVEKPVEIDMREIEKPAEIPEIPEIPKPFTLPKKKRKSVMMEGLLLKRYGTVSVWKPVVDFILDNVSGEFARKDVAALVSTGYKTLLKRKIKQSSADTYAGYYVRYMDEDSSPLLIERCDDPNVSPVVLYRRIKPEVTEKPPKAEIVEEPPKETLPEPSKEEEKPVELPKVAKDIYDLAVEKKWLGSGVPVNVKLIEGYLKDYSSDEIKTGLVHFIKEGKAWQSSPGKVAFK